MYHILRRQAEEMILTNMPAFLREDYQPKDNLERLALTGVCQFQNLNATGARLWADAFSADPTLLEKDCGYDAARFAALAGSGRGDDVANLSDSDRAHLRKQAREWLLAELISCESKLADGPEARKSVQTTLSSWSTSPDLSGIREAGSIAQLPAAEQSDCIALWTQYKTVLNRASPTTVP